MFIFILHQSLYVHTLDNVSNYLLFAFVTVNNLLHALISVDVIIYTLNSVKIKVSANMM